MAFWKKNSTDFNTCEIFVNEKIADKYDDNNVDLNICIHKVKAKKKNIVFAVFQQILEMF